MFSLLITQKSLVDKSLKNPMPTTARIQSDGTAPPLCNMLHSPMLQALPYATTLIFPVFTENIQRWQFPQYKRWHKNTKKAPFEAICQELFSNQPVKIR